MRGLLPAAVWKRLPVVEDFAVRTTHGGFRYVRVDGDLGARPLYWRGTRAYEPETLEVFEESCRGSRVVVDVGANAGVFSLLACAASPSLQVHSFEPVPRVRDLLERNIEANGLEDRVTVYPQALADYAGSADFILPNRTLPASAHLAGAAYRSHAGQLVTVPVSRLDDLVNGPVDIVKIDVEGAEHRVLGGMTRILSEQRPHLFVECLPEGPYALVQAILDEHGYRYEHLTDQGPKPVDAIAPDPDRRFRNFLCRAR